ncbi:peptidase C39 family protein [Nocardioides lentus]|uniref:Peptidase C39 family protein n=1 Tax=Nocardioides lentus TaxID=338077 RepID=A0ABN2PAN6_9ACTN
MPSFPTVRATLLGFPLAATLLAPALVAPVVVSTATAPGAVAAVAAATPSASAETTGRRITYREWATGPQLAKGARQHTYVAKGAVRLRTGAPVVSVGGQRWSAGSWTSPWTRPGYGLTELVASWDATTPGNSWVRVEVRGKGGGATSSWDTLAEWTSGDAHRRRTTISGQDDDLARVNVDTWVANRAEGLGAWQLRATLFRAAGAGGAVPTLDTVGAMVSRLPSDARVPVSAPGEARGRVLDVPSYSQMIHRGHHPQYGNGGEAWCSPTSISMVLGYHRSLPGPRTTAWTSGPDPFVDHAARMSYDYGYRGAGNWPFGTAYAAQHVANAFVTRLRSLREAEKFVVAGIPLVASIRFGSGQLTGAPISSSNGHLLVIVGFTRSGDVVVNDPAASSNAGVRRTYDRAQFENAWIPKSGGLVYVVRDEKRLPGRVAGATRNW